MKKYNTKFLALVVVCLLIFLAVLIIPQTNKFAIPAVLVFLGLFSIFNGINGIKNKRMKESSRYGGIIKTYTGKSATREGIINIILGIVFLAIAYSVIHLL